MNFKTGGPAVSELSRTFDFKAVDQDGSFEGMASVFNMVDDGRDIVMPGAFTDTLKERPAERIKMLWQHSPNEPIGVWEEVKETAQGLFARGRLLVGKVAKATEIHALMLAGAVDGLSIGFRTLDYEHDSQTGGRKLFKVDLFEISAVTFPMQDASRVAAVKASDIKTIREFETFLRDEGGYSRDAAKAIAAAGFKACDPNPRDEVGGREISESLGGLLHALTN